MKSKVGSRKSKGQGDIRHSPFADPEKRSSDISLPSQGEGRGWGGGSARHCAAAALVAAALAGCGQQPVVAEYNYLTYDHPFTEAAAESARQNAEGRCRQRGEIAIQTSRACSLTQCTTSYQCASSADVKIEAPAKKK